MFHTGYSIVDAGKKEIQFWGNAIGELASMPDVLFLPGDLHIHAPQLNKNYNGYMLVKRYIDDTPPPSPWHTKDKETIAWNADQGGIVVTYTYSATPVTFPQTVTPLQFRRALRHLNLKTIVDQYAAQLPEEEKEAWEYATEISFTDPFIVQATTALGKTEDDLKNISV